MSTINIGAVIPTFNRVASLRRILTCLQQQVLPENTRLSPIAVVDGSTDGTLEMINAEFPGTAIVHGSGSWWYTRCINEGITRGRELGCNFILTLNDDITFSPDYVATLLRDQQNAGPDAIMGSVSLSNSEPRMITFSGVSRVNLVLKEFNYIPKFSPVDESSLAGVKPSIVLSGRGILYPMSIFDRFGLYDARLVQYTSETDFTYTASRNGIPVMISYNARVYENVQLTSAGAVYNNPSVKALIKSFRNKYSINSFERVRYYSVKHRGLAFGSLLCLLRTAGVIKNFALVKLKNKG